MSKHRGKDRSDGCKGGCDSTTFNGNNSSLIDLAECFKKHQKCVLKRELNHYARKTLLEKYSNETEIRKALLDRVARAERPDGKRHSHQCQIEEDAFNKAGVRIREFVPWEISNFGELYNCVNRVLRTINGIGDLMIYDTSLRIGWFINVYPETVYVQRGALKGARKLKLPVKNKQVLANKIPIELTDRLNCYEIEAFFCICRKCFGEIYQPTTPDAGDSR